MSDSSPRTPFQIRLPLILAAVLALGMFIGQRLPRYEQSVRFLPGRQQTGGLGGTIDEILRYIDELYVDTVNVNSIKLKAINNLLEELDPHTVYISPEEVRAVQDDMSGRFEGIGIEFIIVDDTIQVVTPMAGGPAESVGIMAGDRIVSIEDTSVAGVKIETGDIFKRLRGPKGSKVQIGIVRGREASVRQFTIVRDLIPVKSLEVAYMMDEQTGYFKINRFSAETSQEFLQALTPMVEQQGMKNMIIDLRGNPGGYLNEAVDLLSQFFPEDKLLVYTEGRAEERREYKSNGRARFDIQNIAVLIDEGSASASEIVAGAIQDHDRGWIIGRRSYGKGLVQEQYELNDGGALRLTIARYYTPSGRSIQRAYKSRQDYNHEAERRLASGELSGRTSVQISDTTRYFTGQGRVVFGGGGISPDVFIPLDTNYTSPYYFEARQYIPQFVSRWKEQQPDLPTDLDGFLHSFEVSNDMLYQFTQYAEKQGLALKPEQLERSRRELKLELKARLGKVLFGDLGLYRVLNGDDPAVAKALQVVRSGEPVAARKK